MVSCFFLIQYCLQSDEWKVVNFKVVSQVPPLFNVAITTQNTAELITRKTTGTAKKPARPRTLLCDIQINVVINYQQVHIYDTDLPPLAFYVNFVMMPLKSHYMVCYWCLVVSYGLKIGWFTRYNPSKFGWPWIWPFKVPQEQMWWCCWTLPICFPVDC